MTTRFGSRLKKADNLFIAPLLRGGRVTPNDIVNSYKYSEARRFAILKEMYQDIEAARTLGMSNSKIRREIQKRKGIKKYWSKLYGSLWYSQRFECCRPKSSSKLKQFIDRERTSFV